MALRNSCSFCVVLNAGKLVAPEISAFVKFAPVTVAPEKFALLRLAPDSVTLVRTVFTNDIPVRFLFARLVVTVVPERSAAPPMVIVNVVFVGALYCALDAWEAVMVTDPISSGVTSPVVDPTVAIAVLLLVYVTAPLLAPIGKTVSVLLVTGVGALYCAV